MKKSPLFNYLNSVIPLLDKSGWIGIAFLVSYPVSDGQFIPIVCFDFGLFENRDKLAFLFKISDKEGNRHDESVTIGKERATECLLEPYGICAVGIGQWMNRLNEDGKSLEQSFIGENFFAPKNIWENLDYCSTILVGDSQLLDDGFHPRMHRCEDFAFFSFETSDEIDIHIHSKYGLVRPVFHEQDGVISTANGAINFGRQIHLLGLTVKSEKAGPSYFGVAHMEDLFKAYRAKYGLAEPTKQ